ncbi:HIT domain-containing protein [Thalassomonas sp. M1454]|uniref:HIT domain-containing protein n=1 Tax=Thalassomonas sp. M1454 TaxID=2594477 RepID=UPI0011800A74|nr:HIT domain-containing protein [Thalassomonas sp. M1454]TRX57483.1 HIT family protein [Thalassomonas sp. M1454]
MSEEFKLHPDLQRDGIEIADLPLCKLLLCNDSNYPWFIMVPKRSDVKDIYELSWTDQLQFLNESSAVSEILMQCFNGDKMNVAALGNVTPQLHIHHVVRFAEDPSWPKPIWGQLPLVPYSEKELNSLKGKLIPMLNEVLKTDTQ